MKEEKTLLAAWKLRENKWMQHVLWHDSLMNKALIDIRLCPGIAMPLVAVG